MPAVLTKSSVIICGHGTGTVDLTAVTAKLTVAGDPVVLVGDITTIVRCSATSPGSTPCTPITLVPGAGVSTKLTVGGKAVMLESVKGSTTGGPPPGVFTVTTVQRKLSAV